MLITDEGVFSESEDILRYADRALAPEERLFPEEQPLRDEVVALCRRFDAGLGPDARRLMYAHMLPRREELLAVNNQGVPGWEDRFLRIGWPLVKRYAARELGIGPTTIRTTIRACAASWTRWRSCSPTDARTCAASASRPPI